MRTRVFLLLSALTCLAETSVWALQPNAEGVYEIGSARDLMDFAALVGSGNYNADACLTADIDMSSVSNFTPIAPSTDNSTAYRGTFDGRGHTVSNLSIHTGADFVGYVGMFSHVYGGVVKNLYLKTVTITTDSETPWATGALMGRNGGSIITNVGVVGVTMNLKATGESLSGHGGIVGSMANTAKSIMDHCFTDFETLCVKEAKAVVHNSYAGTKVKEAASTGELCYMLNGDQSPAMWFQTLGEDPYPVLSPAHKSVYGVGKLTCDGKLQGGALTYTNDPDESSRPSHRYDHGFCTVCGVFNAAYKELVNGAYELHDALDVYWFSELVNRGEKSANARLTDDIDMTEANGVFTSIGSTTSPYGGTFDGGFHTVSNLRIIHEAENYVGFIGSAAAGLTLKNITFDASCAIRGYKYVGIVGGTLKNQIGDIYLANIGNEGTVHASQQYGGGIIGYSRMNTPIHIMYCYTTGEITGHGENGAIAGWLDGGGSMVSCYSIARVQNPLDEVHYLYGCGKDLTHERLYATRGQQGTIVTDNQMASGEVCWLLNGATIYAAHWYQTIGEDQYPRPTAERGLVYKYADCYHSVSDGGEDFRLFRKRMIESGDYLSVIEENRYGAVRAQLTWITLAAILTILLLAISVASILSVRRKERQLVQANQQLQEANAQLELARQQISESVAIKDEYIGRLFYTQSEFAIKMEKLTRTIQNIIKTNQTDNLKQVLRHDEFLTQRGQMYASFDEAFLRLFPDFVEHFNQLFPPDERTYPDVLHSLTSEMRIFALIRLGITDNERIARFLNYSLQTVKNYKTRVKNRSTIPNDEFEARIMSL